MEFRQDNNRDDLKKGDIITLLGGGHWTVPELLFESNKLIPALQQLRAGYHN